MKISDIEEFNEANVEQLFYDLYNNTKNEKADIVEFERLFRQHKKLAILHYVILANYLENQENEFYQKISNEIQDYIAKEIFS